MTLLPFALVLALFALAALIAGLGYRRLGETLAVSAAVSPPTGLMAGIGLLIIVLRLRLDSYAPGLSVASQLFQMLAGASVLTAVFAVGHVAWRVARDRSYLRESARSWGWLTVSLALGLAALALGRA